VWWTQWQQVSWQWMQLWWIWRLRCVVDTVAAGELAVGAALVDLEVALCGGHSGSRWAGSGCSSDGFGGCAVWWTQWQ
jgi:hypothetical protein